MSGRRERDTTTPDTKHDNGMDARRLSINGSLTVVVFHLDRDGRVIGFSPGVKRFFSASKIFKQPISNIVVFDKKKARKTFLPKDGEDTQSVQVQLIGRDEKKIKSSINVSRLRDKRNATIGYNVNATLQDSGELQGLPEGHLLKKTEAPPRRWQKRYFRVRKITRAERPPEFVLDYFTDQQTHVARGSIMLQGATVTTHFQSLVLVVRPVETAREVRLKAATPLLRWQWASSLHKLSQSEATIEEIKAAQKNQSRFRHHRDVEDYKVKKTWRETTGRLGGSEGFQASDAIRFGRALMTGNKKPDLEGRNVYVDPKKTFGLAANTTDYLNVQVISARDLNCSISASIRVRVYLIGPRSWREEVGKTEIGRGKDPSFGTTEVRLTKSRKMHNLLTQLHLPPHEDLMDYDIELKVLEVGALRESELGRVSLPIRALQKGKMRVGWNRLRPLNEGRGLVKSVILFEGKKPMTEARKIDISDDDEDEDEDEDYEASPVNTTRPKPKSLSPQFEAFDEEFENMFRKSRENEEVSKFKMLENEMTMARAKIQELASKLSSAYKLRADQQKNHQMLSTQIAHLKAALDEQLKHKSNAEDALSDAKAARENAIAAREKAMAAKVKAEKDLRVRLQAAKRFYDQEKNGRIRAEKLLAKLQQEGANSSKEKAMVAVAEEERKRLQKELDSIRERANKAEEQRDAAVEDLSNKSKALEEAEQSKKDYLQRIHDLQNMLEEEKKKASNETELKLKAERESRLRLDKIKTLEARIRELEMELDQLKQTGSELSEQSKINAELKDEQARLRAQIIDLNESLEKSNELLNEAQNEAADARVRIAEAEEAQRLAAEKVMKMEAEFKESLAMIEEQKELEASANGLVLPRALKVQLAMYARYFNVVFETNETLRKHKIIPLSEEESESKLAGRHGILREIGSNGLLLAAFLNFSVPDCLDERVMHVSSPKKKLSQEHRAENLELVSQTCYSVGVAVGRPSDLSALLCETLERPRDTLEFLFSLVSFHLFRGVRLERYPKLAKSENDEQFLSDPRKLIPAWVSYEMKTKNVSVNSELKTPWADLAVPVHLACAAVDSAGPLALVYANLKKSELAAELLRPPPGTARLKALSEQLRLLGCKSAASFLIPSRMEASSQEADGDAVIIQETWERANMLYAASLFDTSCEIRDAAGGVKDLDTAGKNSEIAALRVWLNNLGVKDVPRVHDLFAASKDGLLLLRVLDSMAPGCVEWKKAELRPNMKVKRISNCALTVETGKKSPFNFSLVGVGGVDLYSGNKKLSLSLLWQMRRYQLFRFLQGIFRTRRGSMGGTPTGTTVRKRRVSTAASAFDEKMVIDWANRVVRTALEKKGEPAGVRQLGDNAAKEWWKIRSLRDEKLGSSVFYFLLLWAEASWAVNWKFVTPGKTPEHQLLNARYAITAARKLGVAVFVLPEDLVQIKSSMVLVFIGAILALKGEQHGGDAKSRSKKSDSRKAERNKEYKLKRPESPAITIEEGDTTMVLNLQPPRRGSYLSTCGLRMPGVSLPGSPKSDQADDSPAATPPILEDDLFNPLAHTE
mmetsp:Transcript_31693/g.62060  ORF Transcript_31693/g.62060 Transcript_31693/m.62060 type:complete len:1556 (+) Transcript_31693:87-4754(+)